MRPLLSCPYALKMGHPRSRLNCNGGRETKGRLPWISSPWTRGWKDILIKAIILEDSGNWDVMFSLLFNHKMNLEIHSLDIMYGKASFWGAEQKLGTYRPTMKMWMEHFKKCIFWSTIQQNNSEENLHVLLRSEFLIIIWSTFSPFENSLAWNFIKGVNVINIFGWDFSVISCNTKYSCKFTHISRCR